MPMKNTRWVNAGTLAFCIALFPPLWAVAAPYIGVTTGSVALICAGLYVAASNRLDNAPKLSLGFLLGDVWAVLAVHVMAYSPLDGNLTLFLTLFVMGGVAVLVSSALSRWVDTAAWLCGWAIGLTIQSPQALDAAWSLCAQIGVAMLVGVWYVGAFIAAVQPRLARLFGKE